MHAHTGAGVSEGGMSGDYNARLKQHAHKVAPVLPPLLRHLHPANSLLLQGPVDLVEERHTPQQVAAAAAAVARLLKAREGWSAEERERRPVVVLTGAGISTAAGIPDFRGPVGVWTAEAHGRAAPGGTALELAQPTAAHMALVALQVPPPPACALRFALMMLQGRGMVDAVISQNIDGLHLRSGLPPHCLFELHGNSFMERCRRCRKTHFRPFDVRGMSFKPTGRWCEGVKSAAAVAKKRARDGDGRAGAAGGGVEACGGALHDFMLDWGDALPPQQLKESERLCQRAMCLLCLGTSLYINPCGLLPVRAKKAGGKVAIVALSGTAQDAVADIVSHAEADVFMSLLCSELNVDVPRFVPSLTFYVAQACTRLPAAEDSCLSQLQWRIAVTACSDGQPSPLPPLIRAVARVRPIGGSDAEAWGPKDASCRLERCERRDVLL